LLAPAFASDHAQFIPYTVLLLIIGFALGLGARPDGTDTSSGSGSGSGSVVAVGSASGSGSGSGKDLRADYLQTMQILATLDPHTLLYIFLPALLFESAQAIDFHVFKKVAIKTLVLAFPGMALCSLLMSCVVKLSYQNWTWDLCLLLGTITSATDPVAVVALLRELGAKVSLATTIEGESLLNDGSAVVLYMVLKQIAEAGGTVGDAGGIAATFFVKALGGPAIGIVFGTVALWWISHVFNDPMVEISISIATAYLAYYVSEFWCDSSGVLTVVCVGLCFSRGGRTSISPEVFHFLHEFWETLGYLANTIIFLITGIAISYLIVPLFTTQPPRPSPLLTPRDLGISFVIYACGLGIRLFVFLLTYLPFRRTPYGWTWKEMLISSWGGLRGAVGLALGLDVLFSAQSAVPCPDDDPAASPFAPPTISCIALRSTILLHVAMMVLCTLLINAPLMKPLLAVLRFVELSREELTMLALVAERLKKDADQELKRLKEDPFVSNSNWEVVRQFADLNELFRPLLKGTTVKHAPKAVVESEAMSVESAMGADATSARGSMVPASIPEGRQSFIHLTVPEVLARHANDRSSKSDRYSLSQFADEGENTPVPAEDAAAMREDQYESFLLSELKYHYHMSLKAGVWHLQHQGTLGNSATDVLVDVFNHKLDDKHAVDWVNWSELQAAGGQKSNFRPPAWLSAMRQMPFVGTLITRYVLAPQLQTWHDIAFGFLSVHEHLEHEIDHWTTNEKHLSTLQHVMHENMEGARKSLERLQDVLPEVIIDVNTRQAARIMLNTTREKIQGLETAGMLAAPQAAKMVAQVETQMRRLKLWSMSFDLSKERLLREVTWLSELSEDSFAILLEAAQEFPFDTGQFLVRQGELVSKESGCVYLVTRGIVEIVEEYENGDSQVVARRGSGIVIGEQSLLTGAPRAASARACTSVSALGLPHHAMKRAMETYPELAKRMWHHVGKNLCQKLLGDEEERRYGERSSTAEQLLHQAEQWVPSLHALNEWEPGEQMDLERKVLLLSGSCIEFREAEAPPTAAQLGELQLAIARDSQEAIRNEQLQMKQLQRSKTRMRLRKGSMQPRFFGAADQPMSEAPADATDAQAPAPSAPDEPTPRTKGSSPSKDPSMREQTRKVSLSAPVDLGKERRTLHQTSPWIVHIAPCLIDAPPGGVQGRHLLQCLTPCRLCLEPRGLQPNDLSTGEALAEGSPLPMAIAPLELNKELMKALMRKLSRHTYQPGDTLLDAGTLTGSSEPPSVCFVLSGQVACDLDPTAVYDGVDDGGKGGSDGLGHGASHDDPLSSAGEPFVNSASALSTPKGGFGGFGGGGGGAGGAQADDGGKALGRSEGRQGSGVFLLTPPAGAPLGEWLLLQPGLAHVPRVVAHTPTTCVKLSERDLFAAMQKDEGIAHNLWWGRTQREAYCFLRKLEPFCWWYPSKLWRWVMMGKFVKVPEGRGQLGVQAPFVVLVQGRCHVMYQDVGSVSNDAEPAAGGRQQSRGRADRDARRSSLGSMKLLGSGARIADLLTFHHTKAAGGAFGTPSALLRPHSPLAGLAGGGAGGGGRWVPGPEIIHCHEEIAYHFARDSLVFVPSDASLTWLPSSLVFSPGGTSLPPTLNGAERNGVGAGKRADGSALGMGQPLPRTGGSASSGPSGGAGDDSLAA